MNGVGSTSGGGTLGILLGADPQGGLRVEALDSSSPNSASVRPQPCGALAVSKLCLPRRGDPL